MRVRIRRYAAITALTAAAACGIFACPARADATNSGVPAHGFASGGTLDAPPLTQAWSLSADQVDDTAIDGGHVYVVILAPGGTTLKAMDAQTGSPLWSAPLGPGAKMTAGGGQVFATDDSGTLTAYNGTTGAVDWQQTNEDTSLAEAPVYRNGVVYFSDCDDDGGLAVDEAVQANTGNVLWTNSPAGISMNETLAADDHLAYEDDWFESFARAVDPQTGTTWWQTNLEDDAACSQSGTEVESDGGRIIAGSGCGEEFDPATGQVIAKLQFNDAPALAGNTVVTVDGSTAQAIDLTDDQPLWSFSGDAQFLQSPLVVNGTAYLHAASGTLYALDLNTGQVEWTTTAGQPLGPGVLPVTDGLTAGDGILLVSQDDTLIAYRSAAARPGLDVQVLTGPDGPTTATSAQFTFAADDASATTQCRLDDTAWAPCSDAASYAGLADGPHDFLVRTVDEDGVTIGLATRSWSVDTSAPTAVLVEVPRPYDNEHNPYLKFTTADPGARFQCSFDGSAYAPCGYGAVGGETVNVTSEGKHTFAVRALDAAGNIQQTPAVVSWITDFTPPTLTIVSQPPSYTQSPTATFVFSSDESVTFMCGDGNGSALQPCPATYTLSGLPEGNHELQVVAVDRAWNESLTSTMYWHVDDTPPTTQFVSPSPAGGATVTSGDQTIAWTSDEQVASYACSLDGGAYAGCSSGWQLHGLADGPHNVAVVATDQAGNTAAPASLNFTVTSSPPTTTTTTSTPPTGTGTTTTDTTTSTPPTTTTTTDTTTSTTPTETTTTGPGTDTTPTTPTGGVSTNPSQSTTPTGTASPSRPATTVTAPASTPAQTTLSTTEIARDIEAWLGTALPHVTPAKLRAGIDVPLGGPAASTTTLTIRSATGTHAVIASATHRFTAAAWASIRLKLTHAGRTLLGRTTHPRVTLMVRITPAQGAAVSTAKTFRL